MPRMSYARKMEGSTAALASPPDRAGAVGGAATFAGSRTIWGISVGTTGSSGSDDISTTERVRRHSRNAPAPRPNRASKAASSTECGSTMNARGRAAPTLNALPGTGLPPASLSAEAAPWESRRMSPRSSPWRRSRRPPAGSIASSRWRNGAKGNSTQAQPCARSGAPRGTTRLSRRSLPPCDTLCAGGVPSAVCADINCAALA